MPEQSHKPDIQNDRTGFLSKNIGTVVTVVVLIASIIGAWYTNKASVELLQAENKDTKSKLHSIDGSIHEIMLDAALRNSDIQHMQKDIEAISPKLENINGQIKEIRILISKSETKCK